MVIPPCITDTCTLTPLVSVKVFAYLKDNLPIPPVRVGEVIVPTAVVFPLIVGAIVLSIEINAAYVHTQPAFEVLVLYALPSAAVNDWSKSSVPCPYVFTLPHKHPISIRSRAGKKRFVLVFPIIEKFKLLIECCFFVTAQREIHQGAVRTGKGFCLLSSMRVGLLSVQK